MNNSSDTKLNEDKGVKLVVIGDGNVGKTCLLIRFAEDKYVESWVPTIFDHKTTKMKIENQVIDLNLWDTAGQQEFDRLRPLSYPDSDVFLLCFALDFPSSLINIRTKWWPEVQYHKPNTPVLIVGTKLDLMTKKSDPKIMESYKVINREAKAFAESINAVDYIECSALDKVNFSQPFEIAVRAVLFPETIKYKKVRKRICNIL